MKTHLLALDQGTYSSRAIVFHASGKAIRPKARSRAHDSSTAG